jgi:DNA-binding transcriptional regulator LsrR (DeoR family)
MQDTNRVDERWAGRPRKMTEQQLVTALQLYYQEGWPVREVADAIHVSHMTVWRALSRVPVDEAVELSVHNR